MGTSGVMIILMIWAEYDGDIDNSGSTNGEDDNEENHNNDNHYKDNHNKNYYD